MIRCEDIQNLISDYSVGSLDGEQMALFEVHIRECRSCQGELEHLQATMALVESVTELDPPAGMWDGVYAQISGPKPEAKPSFLGWVRSFLAHPQRAIAFGFAVFVMLVIVTFGKIASPPTPAMADDSMQEYVQGHAMAASQDAFADRIGLASVSAASMTGTEAQTR